MSLFSENILMNDFNFLNLLRFISCQNMAYLDTVVDDFKMIMMVMKFLVS